MTIRTKKDIEESKRNNQTIKKSNDYKEHSIAAEQASDYILGFKNPSHIIEKYFKVNDMTQGGFAPFKLFPKQKELIQSYQDNRHNIVTKPRQTGVSTTTAAYCAVKCAYAAKESPEMIIVIANKFTSAKKFLAMIRQFLNMIPKWMWGEHYDNSKETEGHIVGKGSTETLELQNGTIIKALATSPDALRGYTPTLLILDEAAYIDTFAKELYTASVASINTGGKMIIISTPNGFDELYYKTYLNAINKKNGFNIVNIKWYEDLRYNKGLQWYKKSDDGTIEIIDERLFTVESYQNMIEMGYKPTSKWYIEMCATLNNDRLAIARELDVKFEGSAGNVVEYEHIERQEKYRQNPISETEMENSLWIWEPPIAGHKYIMGVDCSSGNSDDYSTLFLMDCDTGNQVAEFKAKIRPEEFAKIVYRMGMEYNALTVVDTTGGYGDIVILKLQEMEFPHLYYNKQTSNEHLKYEKKEDRDKNKLIAGIKITTKRPQIVGKLTNYIENDGLILRSIRFTEELKTFVWVNGRADHMSGFNDDIIIAAAIAIWVLETEYKNIEKAKEKTTAILDILAGKKSSDSNNQSNKKSNDNNNPLIKKHQTNNIYTNNRNYIYRSTQDPTGKDSWVLGYPQKNK